MDFGEPPPQPPPPRGVSHRQGQASRRAKPVFIEPAAVHGSSLLGECLAPGWGDLLFVSKVSAGRRE
jgi:hypothetical protein